MIRMKIDLGQDDQSAFFVVYKQKMIPKSINKVMLEKDSLIAFQKDLERIDNYCPFKRWHVEKWPGEKQCVLAGLILLTIPFAPYMYHVP